MPTSRIPSTRLAEPKAAARKAATARPAATRAGTPIEPAPAKAALRRARRPASLPRSDGDAGVQAYIDSMEPWQAAIARRVDALVVQHVPGVRKAMRWHCPIYGVEGQGWFLAFNAFQRHVKLSFFKGAALDPAPPVGRFKDVRSLDVREADPLDERQLADWIRQAASMPGWDGGSARSGGASL